MSFRVHIARSVEQALRRFVSIRDIFALYGFYAQKDGSLQVVEAVPVKEMGDPLTSLELKRGPLDLAGWAYVRDPNESFIPLEKFRTQTRIQDIMPHAVMCIVDQDPEKDIRALWIHGLKLERVPVSVEDTPRAALDTIIRQQQNLAPFTEQAKPVVEDVREERIIPTKKGMIISLMDEIDEKIAYLASLGKDTREYEDYYRAKELAKESLYGRAAFYLRKVQKVIEEDVVQYRYKDKYEQLLATVEEQLPPELRKATRTDEQDVLASIEMRLNRAASHYHVERYKEAYAELSSACVDLPSLQRAPAPPAEQGAADDLGAYQAISDLPLMEEMPAVAFDEEPAPVIAPLMRLEELESERNKTSPKTPGNDILAELAARSDPFERISFLESIQREQPLNEWVWGELGDAFFEAGEMEKAIAAYRNQLKRTPDNAILLNNLGMIYKLQYHYRQAIDFFKKAIDADPGYAEAHYNYGFIMFEEGDLEEAIASYERALELNPDFNLARDSLEVATKRRTSYASQHRISLQHKDGI
ncbi:MAG: tetratricopeptide repeat protein [Candidatus Methanofastidiosa archaeon]|jgi:tetratricopeptide (TPR) repeat protein|nr:tetratricopeptide repeat protein [Candidatus Methanofastidiosa archaeon]